MELALSLGDSSKPFSFLDHNKILGTDLGFCMAVDKETGLSSSSDPPVQLDLLPSLSPVQGISQVPKKYFPLTWLRDHNSPTELGVVDRGDSCSRGSTDEEENGNARKKLRLSKQQSAFLEESFKQHHALNPKEKVALAKQLNLRPRQVEVWFQNRRARTKLKQTEVDCEYLKRCCETLTEENRRLQKELQELRALKASKPFYTQLPPTTLTMCPSCERVVTTTTTTTPATAGSGGAPPSTTTAAANKLTELFPLSTSTAQAQ